MAGVTSEQHFGDMSARWEIFRLYKTTSGTLVGSKEFHSQWQGEGPQEDAEILKDDAAVLEYFGYGVLAKELYEEAQIDYTITID